MRTFMVYVTSSNTTEWFHRWFKKQDDHMIGVVASQRIIQLSGSLIFRQTTLQDGGKYVCIVNNTVGSQQAQTSLIVSGKDTFFY